MHDRQTDQLTSVGSTRRAPRLRRLVLACLAAFLVSAMSAGPALAKDFIGTDQPETIEGTPLQDSIWGKKGADILKGKGSSDYIVVGKSAT